MAELTPVMRQYKNVKDRYEKEIVLFRMGDFYEIFGQDAEQAAPILNIALTARYKGTEKEIPMCGFPHHASRQYVAKLARAGKRVAICDQVGEVGQGIVDRNVVRVITPGTILDEDVLDSKTNNFLMSLTWKNQQWGLAVCDLTTGDFEAGEIKSLEILQSEINRLNPSEFIVAHSVSNVDELSDFVSALKNVSIYNLPAFENASKLLLNHFKVHDLNSFGLQGLDLAVGAAANLLNYLNETQKTKLDHILKIRRYVPEQFMLLDEATVTNLELVFSTTTRSVEASLLGVIDKTTTAMGGRLLRRWLLLPLRDIVSIKKRLAGVEFFYKNFQQTKKLVEILKRVSDIERLVGRLGCGRGNARDLNYLTESLEALPDVLSAVGAQTGNVLEDFVKQIVLQNDLIDLIKKAIKENAPVSIVDGGLIADGYDGRLDELRKITLGGKEWLKNMQAQEVARTGVSSLKVGYNRVFGYFIEISKSNLDAVPENYIRKQTLVNAERFITPELKEHEEQVLNAEEEIKQREMQIFYEVVEQVGKKFGQLQEIAGALAGIDVLASFAALAKQNNYCAPEIHDDDLLEVRDGRHPVIEQIQKEPYVPNGLRLDHVAEEIVLLTGPNMSGKSSYLRQNALIVLLAQIGSFVPARFARVGVVDRIFTRVGASDNLVFGRSTFMVEMQEMANILNNATEKSLVILDELGRGTATYDGLSIAWAVVEFLHDKLGARTLFATHYHELTDLEHKLERVKNYCVAVGENEGRVVFLHQIIKGAANKSYGIEVGRLAGLPDDLTARADEILQDLETKSQLNLNTKKAKQDALPLPITLQEKKVTKELVALEVDKMTPIEALQKIADMKKRLAE